MRSKGTLASVMIKKAFRIILMSILLLFITNIFISWPYIIPTASMANTLQEGDVILVSKLNYGPRLDLNSILLNSLQRHLRSWRLPGLSSIKRNDILVFDSPDLTKVLVKRCVGLPGEELDIEHCNLYIDHHYAAAGRSVLFDFKVLPSGDTSLFMKTLREMDIPRSQIRYIYQKKVFILTLPEQKAFHLMELFRYFRIIRIEKRPGDNQDIFPLNRHPSWSRDNYGPVKIPKAGQTVKLDKDSFFLYKDIIMRENNDVTIKDLVVYIKHRPVRYYRFKNDYYFCMGDNRHHSSDSRWSGFISKEQIIGKAVFILYSKDMKTDAYRSDRFFCRLDQ